MFPPGKNSQLDSLGPSSKLSITTGGLCKELPSMMRSSITQTSSFFPERHNIVEIITHWFFYRFRRHEGNVEKKWTRDVKRVQIMWILMCNHTMCPHTAVVRLPESEAGGVGLSAGWQWQVEEQSVCGSWEVKLIQHEPADPSIHRVLQQHWMGALWNTYTHMINYCKYILIKTQYLNQKHRCTRRK